MSSRFNGFARQLRSFISSNATSRGDTRAGSPGSRKLRLENLEAREMLSVSPADYQTLQQTYNELQLTQDYDQVNIIELSDFTAQALQDALDQAAQTEQDDVIVLNTELFANQRLELDDTTITVDVDAQHGDVYILSYGDDRASIAVNETKLSFDVQNGNVFLGGVDFVEIASPKLLYQVAVSLAVDAPQSQFTGQDLGYYSVSGEDLATLYSPGYYSEIAKSQIRDAFTHKNDLIGNAADEINDNDYAVLFVGGYNAYNMHTMYYDTLVDVYKLLTVNYCIAPENIYVLYADGDTTGTSINRGTYYTSDMSFATDLGSTVLAANSETLMETFQTISEKVNSDSHVLLWTYDHGEGVENDPDDYNDELVGWKTFVPGSTVRDAVYQIKTGYVTCAFGQCFSGGILDDILDPATGQTYSSYDGSAVFSGGAAANHYEVAWSYTTTPARGYIQSFNNALKLYSTTDEVFSYAETNDPFRAKEAYENNKGTWYDSDLYAKEHPWHAGENFSVFSTEYQTTKWVVTTTEDSNLIPGSLRYCLYNAGKGEIITFDESLAGETIRLNHSLYLYDNVTIDATALMTDGKPGITISGQGASRGMYIANTSVNLYGLEFIDCNQAIYSSYSYLTVDECVFKDNYYSSDGSAISAYSYSTPVQTIITNSTFVNNNGSAAIYAKHYTSAANCYIANCILDNNDSGVKIEGRTSATLHNNVITGSGGYSSKGIEISTYNNAEAIVIENCALSNNWCGVHINNSSTVDIKECVISNNHQGVYQDYASSKAYITNCSIINNRFIGYHLIIGDAFLESSFVQENDWDGLYIASNANMSVNNCVISDNQSYAGAGIYLYGKLNLINSTVTHNYAFNGGGGIYLALAAKLNVYNSIIADNTCTYSDRRDVYFNSSSATANAYNTLSSFTNWTESTNCYTYDENKPLFVDADGKDYRLAAGSQAVDKGNSQYLEDKGVEEDVLANPRYVGDTIDLGAYEYQGSTDAQFDLNASLTGVFMVGSPMIVTTSPITTTATYQWYYATSKNAKTWTLIEDATEPTYIPKSKQLGKYLKVVVTGTGAYEGTEELVSERVIGSRLKAPTLTVDSDQTTAKTVTLNWKSIAYIRGYQLQYRKSSDSSWVTISDIDKTATSYTVTDLNPGTTYKFRILAVGNNTTLFNSPYSDVISETTVTSTLGKVTLSGDTEIGAPVEASITPKQATVTYQWYYASSKTATNWTTIVGATSSSYTLTDANLNKFLKVVATGTDVYEGQTVEAISNRVWTRLVAPTLTVTDVNANDVTLNWDAVVHIRGYQIQYKASNDSDWTTITNIDKTATSYTVTELNQNTSYQFRIMVTGNNTYYYDSEYSAEVSATTQIGELTAVTLCGDLALGNAVNAITTTKGAEATYQWYSATSKTTTNWSKIAGATGASYTPNSARLNKYLKVVVTGVGVNAGQYAEAITDGVVWTQLVAPTLTVGDVTHSTVALSWDAVDHIRAYQIQYKASDDDAWVTISDIAKTQTSYTVEELNSYTNYQFRIMATGNNAYYFDSEYSEDVSATTASALLLDAVTISGDLSAGNPVTAIVTPQDATVTYQWYNTFSINAPNWTKITGATDASYTPTEDRITKYLKVVVTGTGDYAGQTAEAIADRVVWTKLATPTLVVDSEQTTENSITVKWNEIIHIRGYQLQYKASSDSQWSTVKIIYTNVVSYTFTGLEEGVSYDFRIMVNGNNESYYSSDYSEIVTARTNGASILEQVVINGDLEVGQPVIATLEPSDATATYQWYSATSKTATTWTKIAGATKANYTPNSVRIGKYLKVVATGTGDYEGQTAEAITESIVWAKLQAPTLTVDAESTTETSLTLNWDAVAHIRGYQLQYKLESDADWTTIGGIATTATSYTLADLTPGADYLVRIMVTGNNTTYYDSDYSEAVAASTNVVPLEQVVINGDLEVGNVVTATLEPSDATVTYQWYSATSKTAMNWTTIAGATKASYTPNSVRIGKYLKVVVTGTGAYEGQSAEAITESIVWAKLQAPTLAIASATDTSVTLQWDAVAHIRSYQIQYKLDSDDDWTTISGIATTSTSQTITGLTAGANYQFRIKVVGNNTSYYDSEFSDVLAYQLGDASNSLLDDAFGSLKDDELLTLL